MKKQCWHILVIAICTLPILAFAERDILYETKILAEWGKTTSQYELGLMYYNGQGVEQNYKEAFKWFRLAAQKGLPDALFYFGLMHYEGKAVAQNYSNALLLFLEAAKQGQAQAQFIIGNMYLSDQGVKRNYIKAYAWMSIAFKNGNELAKPKLQFLNKEMTASELEKAMIEETRLLRSFSQSSAN
jgi:TPR repeat protein